MIKIILLFILFSLSISFEVEEQLSITELEEEAQLFILNESYLDAISNYEKIYDIQSLIFGVNHKNVSNTLIVLGDLYYKSNDEINALRCFQESIRIIHYNYMISNQSFITPLEYLFEIYLNNEQIEIAGEISDKLSALYSLDTLSYDMVSWSEILNNRLYTDSYDTLNTTNDSSIVFINPQAYLDSAKIYINSNQYKESVAPLLSAFIEGYDIFTYNDYSIFFTSFNNNQLNELSDFLQILKYSDSQDIQATIYFYLAIISYQLGNNNLSFSYITEFSRLMPDEIMTFILSGDIYYNRKEYIEALSEYQKILWIYPNDSVALFQQSLCFYQLNYYEDAKLNFNKILSNNNDHYESIYYLALIEYESQNYDTAIDLFSRLLLHSSKDSEIYNYLGELYYKKDNLKLALYSYEQSIKINPYNSNVYYYLGIIYEQLLSPTKSIQNYNQAIQMDNNNLDLIYRLGMILYKQGELKKSIEYLRRYVVSNYEDIEVLEILADILNKLDRFPESIEIYKKLIEFDKGNQSYYLKLAKLYWKLDDYQKSKYYYTILLDNNNDTDGEIFYYLGFIANKNQEYELAKNYLFSAYECGYSTNELYNQFAISYNKTKDYRDMIFILNEGLNFNPSNQNIIYYLGLAYYEIGFYTKAIQLLKNYHLYNPNDMTASYTIGMAYFNNEDYINSFKYLNIANSNDDYEILYYLASCKYHLKKHQEAIPFYKKSLIINPQNPYAIYLLGQTYIVLGDKKESKRQLKLLRDLDDILFETLKLSFNTKFDI